jgi:hypothetical protein
VNFARRVVDGNDLCVCHQGVIWILYCSNNGALIALTSNRDGKREAQEHRARKTEAESSEFHDFSSREKNEVFFVLCRERFPMSRFNKQVPSAHWAEARFDRIGLNAETATRFEFVVLVNEVLDSFLVVSIVFYCVNCKVFLALNRG